MKSYYKVYSLIVVLSAILYSCGKPDDYKKYMEGGEIIYPAKADSIKAYPGHNRIMLSWVKTDPRVVKYRIYWNLDRDSMDFDVPPTPDATKPDTMKVIVDNLEEADYEFTIVSLDADGNRSIKAMVVGKVYGENYRNSLLNRLMKRAYYMDGSNLAEIEWYPSDTTEMGVELTYTTNGSKEVVIVIAQDDNYIRLDDYKLGTPFSYRTMFMPEKGSIDTFYTTTAGAASIPVSYPLNKSKFKEYLLPRDAGTAWGWLLSYLWDGNVAEGRGYHTPDIGLPLQFTFDLGTRTSLHEIKVWQRQGPGNSYLYDKGNIKRFEIWGTDAPPFDGSYYGWTKLLDCTSIKPSGAPLGTVFAKDIEHANTGESFIFPSGSPTVRYIRIKILENWGNSPSIHIMEASFWGSQDD